MGHHQLDALDQKILSMVSANARVPFLEVARACDVSGAAIHQRIQKLTSLGVLKGSEFNLDPQKIGWETCAYVGLFLKGTSSSEEVIEGLKQIPEVVECHYTTGEYDVFIKMYAKNNLALSKIIQEKIHPLGVRTTSIISYEEIFRHQIPIPEIEEE
jgi:Lrp/AsnC family transcriptional regulator for asnA, asnC and gidA